MALSLDYTLMNKIMLELMNEQEPELEYMSEKMIKISRQEEGVIVS